MNRAIEVDCLVIGAGPVGSVAAERLAVKGHKVLMIEKRSEIGVPVRCGEGISKSLLEVIDMEPDPRWISTVMDGAKIISPSGYNFILGPEIAGPEVGFVIRRDLFDKELAKRAARAGADIWVMTEATSFSSDGRRARVKCIRLGEEIIIDTKVVIAADGFESKVARWAGLDPSLSETDVDSCIQYLMQGVDATEKYTEFYIGKKYAPGGYVWFFPKEDDMANVGIGVNASLLKGKGEVKRYLDDFIESNDRFKNAKIVEINGGGVSVSLPMEKTHTDNLLVVGDAARMIDPMTGGGLYNGCKAAIQAARAADEALRNGKYDSRSLEIYETYWRSEIEEEISRNYLAKETFLKVEDSTLDKIVDAISEYDLKKISIEGLLEAISAKYPEAVKEVFGS